MIIAKIETKAAVLNLEGIIEASGAVMVARGDLGSEADIEELPHLQKHIIQECIALGRPAITATQMLESMVSRPHQHALRRQTSPMRSLTEHQLSCWRKPQSGEIPLTR